MAYRRGRGLTSQAALVCMMILLLGLAGCSMLNGFLDPGKLGDFPAEYKEGGIRRVLTPRDSPYGPPGASEPTPEDLVPLYEDYRLAAGDVITVIIEGLRNPGVPEQLQLEVSASGNIRIPYLGAVKAAGLTELELENELEARLQDAELVPAAEVNVYAQTKQERSIVVRGWVGRPGLYPLPKPDLRLLEFIGVIGDIGADVKRFYIIRREETDELPLAPLPGAQPGELLYEPPPGPDDDRFGTFSAQQGGGQPPPAETQPEITREQLEDVMTPPLTTRGAEEPALAPIIFDPRTGELVERAPEATLREEAAAPLPPEEMLEEEPFDWEDVPPIELSQRIIEIDARALFNGDPRYNVVLRPQDVLSVPYDTGVFYVMGEVNRPGVYAFSGREITLKQAIALTGGLGPLAWPMRVEIIRHEPGTDKQITIPVNLDAIFSGLEDDLYLRDDDVVNVGTSVISPFLFVIRNSFRFTYGFGFVYDRNFADKDAYGARINPEALEIQRRSQRGLPF